jgi:site-specific DNA-methyltransferase (adenine-specific)
MKSIHVLRKPCSESTVTANVLKHGTGGINVDGSRIGTTVETWPTSRSYPYGGGVTYGSKAAPTEVTQAAPPGRWPANLVLGACLDSELGSAARYFLRVGE